MTEENNNENVDPKTQLDPSYAPANPTDGRSIGNWQSRYPVEANIIIKKEAFYVGVLLVLIPSLLICIHQDFFKLFIIPDVIKKYSYAWLGGMLGGVLFSIKWLYHSVARFLWNQDRWLWRLFTPHISGALSFSFVILISSGIINIFSPEALNKPTAVFGLSFLVGYFSDSAIAKLNEVAITLFGSTEKGKKEPSPDK
jgi:hypothetical protein